MEFAKGTPLGKVEITLSEIYKVFNIIKKLRENKECMAILSLIIL